MDDFAVHIRMYSNKYYSKPVHLNSDTLEILIGHSPLDRKGFLLDHTELIGTEKVNDSELERYKTYLEEMKKNN